MNEELTSEHAGRNFILTTPGGSGSTYLCEALNKFPNVVALNEPIPLRVYREESTDDIWERLESFFQQARSSLLDAGTAIQGNGRGKHFAFDFGKQHEPFNLVIKQPLTFTALLKKERLAITQPPGSTALPEVNRCDWYALVRNPLLTLCSWVGSGLQAGEEGRATTAERHDPELERLLDEKGECKEILRLALLNWAFEKYATLLTDDYVIKYEEFVESPLAALEKIIPAANQSTLQIPIKDGNANPKHRVNAELFAWRVLKETDDAPIWTYYSKKDIEDALDRLRRLPVKQGAEQP
jgi:hypothetical protein